MAGGDDPLLERRPDAPEAADPNGLRYADDTWVPTGPRDTVSAALLAAGIPGTSRSLKLRRPRGPYCLRGDCGTCLVRIDGLPNRRACMAAARPGMQVRPQNVLTVEGPDPTALADKFFADGLDHHHFMVRPRIVNQIMQGVARNLAGLGTLPPRPPDVPARHEHHDTTVLVIGGGPAGTAAATVLREAGIDSVVVDRQDRIGLEPNARAVDHPATGVFGIYGPEATVAAMTDGMPARTPDVLRTFGARHVVLATGATEPMIPLENNDLPGVVAAEGLRRLVARCGMRPAGPVVVVGAGPRAQAAASALGAEVVTPDEVVELRGNHRVHEVRLRQGRRDCTLVALAPPPAPASDLARQAGGDVTWNGSGFAVAREHTGRVPAPGPWTLWAAGQVAGVAESASADDGRRVGLVIAAAVRGGRGGPPRR